MKTIIFGATGKTGVELATQALDKGHTVTTFVRDAARKMNEHENLTQFVGDVFDIPSVEKAVMGQDAVICALGAGSSLKNTNVRTTGTSIIIKAMHTHNVKRLIVISAMGVGDSWNTLSAFNKFIFATLLFSSRKDHEAQEVLVRKSKLDWTIVRPSGLTDGPRTGVYDVGENILAKTSRIARADVADLIVSEIEQNSLVGKAVTITN
ncbi:MAG: SDR family oxidoreductase [Anaerolineae bacterium]|nr:SDR family oxidoreductase [Anaerolineae bacterium]